MPDIFTAFALAYEAVDFELPQTAGDFSLQIPEGWTVQPNEKDTGRVDYFDEDIKGKEHGIIQTVWKDSSESLFQTVDEANALLLARVKKEKIKDYQLAVVAGYPAVCWTNTLTLAAVKKTYVHGVYLLGQTGELDLLFSTRSGDKEVQAAEFEKLLATVTAAEALTAAQSTLPWVREIVGSGLTFEEAGDKLTELLGRSLSFNRYIDRRTQAEVIMWASAGKSISFLGMEGTYQYYQYEDNAKPVEYFQTYMAKEEKLTVAEGAERMLSLAERMRLDFGDVVQMRVERENESKTGMEEILRADAAFDLEEMMALLEENQGKLLNLMLYFGEGKEKLDMRMYPGTEGKTKDGGIYYLFGFQVTLLTDALE